MVKKALLTFVMALGSIGSIQAFLLLNNQRPLYEGKTSETFGIASQADVESGSLHGRVMAIGQRTLTPLIPINGQPVPTPEQYRNKTITVGGLMNKGRPGIDKRDYYEIQISGVEGSFLIPETALGGLSSYNSVKKTNQVLNTVKQDGPAPLGPAPLGPCPGPPPSLEQQEEYKDELYKQRAERRPSVLPESRYTPATRNESSRERREQIGEAPFAGGETMAVGDGTGLINTKSDDPNADNATAGCEVLTASEDERANNSDLEYTEENLSTCISNIQKYMLQDISPPAKSRDRNKVFSRLFELPNQEQEFAAAIFTLTGEMERGNTSDGLMILKVLSNRRDNSNRVEEAIASCKKIQDKEEKSTCYAQANENSVFNLLDAALHRAKTGNGYSKYGQFSMYNDAGNNTQGNWASTIGNPRNNNFDEALRTFVAYSQIEDYNITGGSQVDINKIYHYTRPEWDPSWARGKQQLRISAVHPEEGELKRTNAHVYFENLDGQNDGFAMNITHEFRRFP